MSGRTFNCGDRVYHQDLHMFGTCQETVQVEFHDDDWSPTVRVRFDLDGDGPARVVKAWRLDPAGAR